MLEPIWFHQAQLKYQNLRIRNKIINKSIFDQTILEILDQLINYGK